MFVIMRIFDVVYIPRIIIILIFYSVVQGTRSKSYYPSDKDHNKKTYPEVKVRICAFSGANFDESLRSAPSFSRFRPVGRQAGLNDNVYRVTKNIYRCLSREFNLVRPIRTYPVQILICITYNWSVMQFLCTELYTCLDKLLAIVSKQG